MAASKPADKSPSKAVTQIRGHALVQVPCAPLRSAAEPFDMAAADAILELIVRSTPALTQLPPKEPSADAPAMGTPASLWIKLVSARSGAPPAPLLGSFLSR